MNTSLDILKSLTAETSLGEQSITPTRTQLFMFSAITWNRHQIHFNHNQARAEGFPDIVVQRGLIGNFLARFVTDWMGTRGRLLHLQWKVLKSAFPDQELRCRGKVAQISADATMKNISCQLWLLNPEELLVAEGQAQIEFQTNNKVD